MVPTVMYGRCGELNLQRFLSSKAANPVLVGFYIFFFSVTRED